MKQRIIDLAIGACVVNEIWRYIETILYGEPTPRTADSIIAIVWLAFVIAAYQQGRKDEREWWQP